MFWEKKSFESINQIVNDALIHNQSYLREHIFGIPATYLDPKIFPDRHPFLKEAPFVRSLVENPNHIGVHTLSGSMKNWRGTQKIELEVLRICAEEIFRAKPNCYDGYIPTGGTEGNLQAMWMYRNYYMKEYHMTSNDVVLFYSEDSHYSIPKGINLLGLSSCMLKVDTETREIDLDNLENKIKLNIQNGKSKFIFVLNMGTTMFGSVDDINRVVNVVKKFDCEYKIHIDAAFGGFVYPLINKKFEQSFENENVSSITVDAHKMLQAPYGTGIFLSRKGLINYVETEDAGYIEGHDHTICGSRSGANVVSIWMILAIHGSQEFSSRIHEFWNRTNHLCHLLDQLSVRYYRNPFMNIVTIHSEYIPDDLAVDYELVPETHTRKNKWWKIVVMEHVTEQMIDEFISKLKISLNSLKGA